jgi:hypothetical protein
MHVGIFCNLAKAFDCVNHEILLVKLHFYFIQGTTTTNRKQKTEIKLQKFSSKWGTVKHGVP